MAVKRETVRTGWQEALGITLLAVCILGILSLFSYDSHDVGIIAQPPNHPPANFIGPVGAWFAYLSFMAFGVCGYMVPAALAYIGLLCIFKREGHIWPKAIWMLVMLLGLTILVELNPLTWASLREKLNIGTAGGAVGNVLADMLLVNLMGTVGTTILAITLVVISVVLLFDIHPVAIAHALADGAKLLYEKFEIMRKARMDRKLLLEEEEKELAKRRRKLEESVKDTPVRERAEKARREDTPKRRAMMPEPEPEAEPETAPEPVRPSRSRAATPVEPETTPPEPRSSPPEPEESPEEVRAAGDLIEQAARIVKAVKLRSKTMPDHEPVEKISEKPLAVPPGGTTYSLPPMTLLDDLPPAKDREIKGDFQLGAQVLKETLLEFGIEVEITNVERGPVVTRYEVLPAAGVKVEKIGGLSNNIALAMKAESIRVQAPIPGKGVVGIEISNPKTNKVFLREILESDEWKNSPAALPLVLGQDVGGRVLIADLARMPHLLIAGATGSGKTVCMNSILAGLLMSRTPDQMRLMLIDPKIVEFSGYNGLPHLVVPVITEAKKVSLGLRWAINEMEKRYKMFAKVGVRNIESFNSRVIVKQPELFGEEQVPVPEDEAPELEDAVPDRVPYIVIVVDELADLMLVAQAEVENQIARLAQLSRAVGIHMILATQRPSVNVITGTIKANFPARIAFQVAQANDSRTILDAMGADKLLGKGDMLFLNPGVKQLIRAQGTLTTDGEIHRVVDHLKQQGQPQYETAIKDKLEGKSADIPDMGEDDLMDAALEIIRQTRRASTSSLQRRLRIGYTRAARIMDLLEQKGVVGPAQGSDPREILIDLDGEVPQNEVKEVE
jgi:S-DNA-T family DNA segregation ATPase FtsK/SpoIIIE